MRKRIIEKFLCLHDWKLWTKSTEYYSRQTTEILICKHCGKIRTLKY